ncbi:hypothetical protein NKI72_32190 [Mesorhizobium sp. M0437]|uniref:hypothetical protein n=1 Tax=Mesorhizobium sp. M0437 TaxID=2956945 RepID=UPI00333B4059
MASYLGPENCGGCGAGSEGECDFVTTDDFDAMSAKISASIANSKLQMKLKIVKRQSDRLVLAGSTDAVDSKFFKGYYDRSSASFLVWKLDDQPNGYTIYSRMNVLVSAEPSKIGKNYRDLGIMEGDENLAWFHKELTKILEDSLKVNFSSFTKCDVLSNE